MKDAIDVPLRTYGPAKDHTLTETWLIDWFNQNAACAPGVDDVHRTPVMVAFNLPQLAAAIDKLFEVRGPDALELGAAARRLEKGPLA